VDREAAVPEYPAVPENNATVLTLAGAVGIAVPEHRPVPVDAIEGLPELGPFAGKMALAVRRFERTATGRVHMEDLAQVFGVYPESKYRAIGVAHIAELIGLVMGQESAQDFIARLAFIVLTGNGDMHLKNWSLLYPDGHTPVLAPAYDLVSTVPYIPGESLALSFVKERSFAAITMDRFRQLAARARLSERSTTLTAARIADAVRSTWQVQRSASPMPGELLDRIEAHIAAMPLGR
jgi:serine/threonine-protein kinase HipA